AAQRAGAEPAPQLYAAQAVPRSGAGARAGLGLLARLVGVDVALADRRLESQLERELCAALGFGSARSVGAEQGEIAEAGEVPTLLFGRAALGVLVTMQAVDVGRAGGQHQHAAETRASRHQPRLGAGLDLVVVGGNLTHGALPGADADLVLVDEL